MKDAYLTILLGDHTLALRLENVHKVARMVAVTPVGEGAPRAMLGVVDLGGRVVPVFDPRVRFGLPSKTVDPADQIVFVSTGGRLLGLWVDEAGEVFRQAREAAASDACGEDAGKAAVFAKDALWKQFDGIAGVARLPEGLVVIRDLEAFLSEEDERRLDAAMASLDTAGREGAADQEQNPLRERAR